MVKPRSNRKPTFFWQALLILLPVCVLSVFGVASLRQDRLLVEQEARERAGRVAEDLSERIWNGLLGVNADFVPIGPRSMLEVVGKSRDEVIVEISPEGDLVRPPPFVSAPTPQPLDDASLDEPQREIWREARRADFANADADAAIHAYGRFIESRPPAEFAAAARLSLGVLLLRQRRLSESAEQFGSIADEHPEAVLESGLPARAMAELKLVEICRESSNTVIASAVKSLESICSNALANPTFLTPILLNEVANLERARGRTSGTGTKFLKAWEADERARQLYSAVKGLQRIQSLYHPKDAGPLRPDLFWLDADGSWLVLPFEYSTSNHWIVFRSERLVRSGISTAFQYVTHVPNYFEVNLTLAGKVISERTAPNRADSRHDSTRPAPSRANPLAVVGRPKAGSELLRTAIDLTDPGVLFARQRARTLWFGSLIVASTCAAVIGLVTAWRTFQRQLRLSEMKTNFVSSVSHELRAPIASVRLMAESLVRGKIPDMQKQAEYFRLIEQECRRLTSLVENVLDFSRIDQGRMQYEFEPTDLVSLVEQTVKLMEPCAAEHQVTLSAAIERTQLSTLNPQPEIDGRAIQQALVNLLDNAIKHSPAGKSITVGIEQRRAGVSPARLSKNYASSQLTPDLSAVESKPRREEPTSPSPPTKGGDGRGEEGCCPDSETPLPVRASRGEGEDRCLPTAVPNSMPVTPDSAQQGSGVPRRANELPSWEGPGAGAFVQLWVEDCGEGIPPEEHQRIFEPFYRRGTELRRETQGIGIGLTIVKHIVEAHGGRVLVRSAVGQGSRFTIELPLNQIPRRA